PWGVGPHRAWTAAVEEGLVEPVAYHVDGRLVETVAEPGDRAWATGRFTP
ncbi:MAG: class I SAM-dependent methyltransferase, partial [Saccharothrix sp.]|nr:class I SAM-dependent methyltransferase [Saccharothrix sp.]